MKNIKKSLFIVALMLLAVNIAAQDSQQEISIAVGGGSAGFNPKMINKNIQKTSEKNKNGINFGIGYAYKFSRSFAIVSGLDVDMYQSELEVDRMQGSYLSVDSENDGFLFRYDAKGYKETMKATYISIPLMARYTYELSDSWGLYIAGGAKLGFKASSKYTSTLNSVITEAAYVQWGNGEKVPTIDDEELEGFGTFEDLTSSGKLDLKMKCSAAAELGVQYKVGARSSLYFGGYIDYVLNNMRGSSNYNPIQFNGYDDSKVELNSFSESVYKDKLQNNRIVEKIKPLNVGIKLRFAFAL